ncbi:excinuclease ABC subunit UvrC [Govanella unica]|uniref:UvrABC system protein C n=1 Tax=Govanella unica TaxID=2975056 RepID=A0A9X3TZZ4_9PROT|nr:excinuclease ABC subunit UvrC [Govania unica]MDA5194787.1 excinuclease ABC subunit UvrC [Govania unica]
MTQDVESPDQIAHDQVTVEESDSAPAEGPLARGIGVLKTHLKTMPTVPGVYRMVDDKGEVLYVGKAKSLKARLTSYTIAGNLSNRIARMVARVHSLTVVTTHTEAEALLLESNLIKHFRPYYNVLLKDDKSFPYVRIDRAHAFPRITKHRGARSDKAEYYGPFAAAGAVVKTLNVLQRAFLLRTCSDSVFASRSRPCLLYQIKRCSAPCVGRISATDYDALLQEARDFLSGRSQKVKDTLTARMLTSSEELDFEGAAIYRDRLKALSYVQSNQDIDNARLGDMDVIAAHMAGGHTCVQVFFFRAGQNWGNRAFFPRHDRTQDMAEVLPAFVAQFYADKPVPREILVSHELVEHDLLEEALGAKAGHKVTITLPKRGDRRKLMDLAAVNAKGALERKLAESASQVVLLEQLAETFGLDGPPSRIEIYDNSHIMGTKALGGMVVAGPEGFMKAHYRLFNIRSEEITPGDDFGMMREVMTRRFGRLLRDDPERASAAWPDLVLIDGGLGQLNAVRETLADLGIDDLPLIAIAKGQDRNAGREDFYLPGRAPFKLPPASPVLYYVQRLRDEAHRFAIGGHRARRAKDVRKSILDEVPGIGPARKKALLMHFGSAQAVAGAGIPDLEAVPGVNRATARVIYNHFHDQG